MICPESISLIMFQIIIFFDNFSEDKNLGKQINT